MSLLLATAIPIKQPMAQIKQIFNFAFIIQFLSIWKHEVAMKQRCQKLTAK